MKKILTALLLLTTASSFAQNKNDTLSITTKNYQITITDNCEEGEIACNDVTYHSVNKKNHTELTLSGHTINIGQSEDFRGYDFSNGEYLYRLRPEEDDTWSLYVIKGDKTLLQEKGVEN
ncbi:hypothetical protein [Mangrovibacter phragmitis]|nr:hypothetical protein [Mangrovibacter phragmitis]